MTPSPRASEEQTRTRINGESVPFLEAMAEALKPAAGRRKSARRWGLVALTVAVPLVALASPQHYRDDFHSANEASRIYATLAIVHHGTIQLDPVFDMFFPDWRERNRPPNVDVATRGGHYLLDKAPGISLLGIPIVWAVELLGLALSYSQLAWLMTALLVSVPSMVFLLRFHRWLGLELAPATSLIAPAVVLSTPWLVYGGLLFGHATATALIGLGILSALGPLSQTIETSFEKGPPLLGGLLLGLAVLVEFPTALIVAGALIALGIDKNRRWRLQWLVLGGLGPALTLAIWNTIAFGGPFSFSYGFKANPGHAAAHAEGLYGIAGPSLDGLAGLLVSPQRGLLFLVPWLIVGFGGCLWAARDRSLAPVWRTMLPFALVGSLAVLTGYSHWQGGRSTGPRHILFLIPFLGIGTALALSRLRSWSGFRLLRTAMIGLIISSLAMCLAASLSFPYVSPAITNPVFEVLIPVIVNAGPCPTLWDGMFPPPTGAILVVIACLGTWLLVARRYRSSRKPESDRGDTGRLLLTTVGIAGFVLHISLASLPTTGDGGAEGRARVLSERAFAHEMLGHDEAGFRNRHAVQELFNGDQPQ